MSTFTVHMYGPPGAGKTVILTALNRFLPVDRDQLMDVRKSPALNDQYERVLRGKFPEGTRPKAEAAADDGEPGAGPDSLLMAAGEVMSYRVTQGSAADIVVQVIAHAGEDVLTGEKGADAGSFTRQFANQPSKLLVVVLNPFKSNVALATKALKSLIVTLQSRLGLTFPEALYMAVEALFRLDPAEEVLPEFGPRLDAILKSEGSRIQLSYAADEPSEESRFSWAGVGADMMLQLEAEFGRFVETVVEHHRRYWDPLRQAAHSLENCIVVLTHIDLTDLMPSIAATDFEEVFHETFRGKPERLASQQMLAKMHRLSVNGPDEGGIRPWQLLEGSVDRLHDYIVSFVERCAEDIRVQREAPAGGLRIWQTAGLFTAYFFPLVVMGLLVYKVTRPDALSPWGWLLWILLGSVALVGVGTLTASLTTSVGSGWLRYLRPGRFGDRLLRSGSEVVETHPRRLELNYNVALGRILNFGYVTERGSDDRYAVADLRTCLRAWPKSGKKKTKKDQDEAGEAPERSGAEHRVRWAIDAYVFFWVFVAVLVFILSFVLRDSGPADESADEQSLHLVEPAGPEPRTCRI